MTTRPLLTDEEISKAAWRWGRDQPSIHLPDLVVGFENGTRFARSVYEADRAKLLAEIERLEGMVPKWVEEQSPDEARLSAKGWLEVSRENPTGVCYWLMVPPIPLPKEGE